MNDLRKAAEAALEALEYYRSGEDYQPTPASEAIFSLRAARGQPEPVHRTMIEDFIMSLANEAIRTPEKSIHELLMAIGYVREAQPKSEQEPVAFCDAHCTWLGHHPDCFMARTEKGPEPEPEPVAWNWVFDGEDHGPAYYGKPPDADITKQAEQRGRTVRLLYTAPPQRQPLTQEHILSLFDSHNVYGSKWVEFARAIEKAHGIGGEE